MSVLNFKTYVFLNSFSIYNLYFSKLFKIFFSFILQFLETDFNPKIHFWLQYLNVTSIYEFADTNLLFYIEFTVPDSVNHSADLIRTTVIWLQHLVSLFYFSELLLFCAVLWIFLLEYVEQFVFICRFFRVITRLEIINCSLKIFLLAMIIAMGIERQMMLNDWFIFFNEESLELVMNMFVLHNMINN